MKPCYSVNWGTEDLDYKREFFDALTLMVDDLTEIPSAREVLNRYGVVKVLTPERDLTKRIAIKMPTEGTCTSR